MEVVLLWLDDLDDLVFAGALQASRLRVAALGVAALAAGALTLCLLEVWAETWALTSALAAGLGVSLWLSSGLLGERGAAVPRARA
jgi:hypothetical protein